MTGERRVYKPRLVGGKVMLPADLKRLHKYMLDIEHIDHISDEMRAVVESEWPELAHKLPPQKPQGRTDQLFLYLASFCSSHLRPSGLAIQRSAASLVLCKVGCLSDSR